MFYIVAVSGDEPYVNVVQDPRGYGEAKAFDTEKEAEGYAGKNCAWQWRIVEF